MKILRLTNSNYYTHYCSNIYVLYMLSLFPDFLCIHFTSGRFSVSLWLWADLLKLLSGRHISSFACSLGQCGWCWRGRHGSEGTHMQTSTLRCTCDSSVMRDDSVSTSFLLIMKPISHTGALFFCSAACVLNTHTHTNTLLRDKNKSRCCRSLVLEKRPQYKFNGLSDENWTSLLILLLSLDYIVHKMLSFIA